MNKPISRGFRIIFLLHAVEGFVTGAVLLLVPTIFGNLMGWNMSDAAYRIVGAAALGCALSSWLAYGAENWGEVKIVVEAKVAWMSLAAIAILWALLVGKIPAFGWVFFFVLAVFAAAFGYFLVMYSQTEEPGLSSIH